MDILKKIGISEKSLKALGIEDVLIKPFTKQILVKFLQGINQTEAWKSVEIQSNDEKKDDSERIYKIVDNLFTEIKLENYF